MTNIEHRIMELLEGGAQMSKANIARSIGLGHETVSRAIASLQQRGLVAANGRLWWAAITRDEYYKMRGIK